MENREIWSFFSGAMGLDLGLEQVGLTPTLVLEKDEWCFRTISTNKPELDVIYGDIRDFNADKLRDHRRFKDEVFLVVGGPPCQSFSPGGKRAALSDPRGNLIYEFFRLIKEINPKFFIFENVANIVTAALNHRPIKDRPGQHWSLKKYDTGPNEDRSHLNPDELSGSAIRQLLDDIKDLGYHFTFNVINAADYGTPQHRLRFVMIGSKNEINLQFIKPTHKDVVNNISKYTTLRDAIYDLRENPGPHATYTPSMERYFNLIPEGGNWRNLPEDLQEYAMGGAYESGGGKTGFYRRLAWDFPAPTITGRANRKASAICHPEVTRPLSVRECARIQEFPDSWQFAGSMSQQYQQIGNAVPVGLGRILGKSILQSLQYPQEGYNKAQNVSMEEMIEMSVKILRSAARNKRSSKHEQINFLEEENMI